jgi:hypothetical protein
MSKRYRRTFNHVTFTKNQRLDIMAWSVLFAMTDQEVYEEIRSLTKVNYNHVIDKIANWACLNPTSATFDFPESDRTRALLGALQMGYVTIN